MYKNTVFNILGTLIPSIVAIPTMGYLARVLNEEMFGVLLLTFSILGFSSIFDVGITRAVIRKIAISDTAEDAGIIMGTAFSIVFALSIIALGLITVNSEVITSILNVTGGMSRDVAYSIQVVGVIIPPYLLGMTAFGYLEGKQMFYKLNVCRVVTGVFIAIIPAICVYIHPSLSSAITGLLIARIMLALVAVPICVYEIGFDKFKFSIVELNNMLKYGGWITVSNVISPLMAYADRFILSNLLGAKNAAYYTSASEIISRLAFIPASLARAIFPSLARNEVSAKAIETKSYISLIIVLFSFLFPLYIFSEEIIGIWLGNAYAEKSSLILRVLIFGFFFNSLAQIPFSKIQAIGNSRLTALIHFSELIPYLIILYFMITNYGIIGAAYTWTFRVTIDFIVLYCCSKRV